MTNTKLPVLPSAAQLALVFAGIAGAAFLYGGSATGDDTFIYMRYVQHALAGWGYVFNVGEASYGCTSPLWAFVMTPVAAAFGNHVLTWRVAAAVLFGLRGTVVFSMVQRASGRLLFALTLTAAVSLEPHTFRWAASGMENSLALLLIAVAVQRVMLIGRDDVSLVPLAVTAGLLPFARPELALVSAAIGVLLLFVVDRRRYLTGFAVPAALTSALLLVGVRLAFGAFVPQTAEAKALFLHQAMPLYALKQSAKIAITGCSAIGLSLLLSFGLPRELKLLKAAALTGLAAAIGYLAVQNQLTSTRYQVFLCGPVVTIGAIAVAQRRSRAVWLANSVVAVQLLLSATMLAFTFPATRVSEVADIRRVADVVSATAGGGSRVALSEIGVFGFYSNAYVIDLVGLTDRATLAWGRLHGRLDTVAQLESLLQARGATYYVDSFAQQQPIVGSILNFEPVRDLDVERPILLDGQASHDVWRIYRLTAKDRMPGAFPKGH